MSDRLRSLISEGTENLTFVDAGSITAISVADDATFNIDCSGKNMKYYNLATNSYDDYTTICISSNGWFGFASNIPEANAGTSMNDPTNTLRYFSFDAISTIKYYFDSNNNLMISSVGSYYNDNTDTPFNIVMKIEPNGKITINYKSIGSGNGSSFPIIGWVGNDPNTTNDSVFYSTFDSLSYNSSNINGKILIFNFTNSINVNFWSTTFLSNFSSINKTYTDSPFTLVNPSSNSAGGTFSYTSSNTSVATILGNEVTIQGVGSSTITAYLSEFAEPGLLYNRYYGYFNDDVNWFSSQTSWSLVGVSTSINNFSLSTTNSIEWIGYFKPNETGTWTFYTYSDDSSLLWLGNNAISGYTIQNALVDNSGLHMPRTRSETIDLIANIYYPIRIQYGENLGGSVMSFSFKGASSSTPTTDGSNFFYKNTYSSGTATTTLSVAKGTPTITNYPATISKTYTDSPFTLNPSSNSSGTFSYTSSNPSVATISGNVVTIVSAGSSVITATQAETNNFNQISVTTTLSVAKANPTIINYPASITKSYYTDSPFTLVNPSSNSPGTFSYSSSNTSLISVSGNTATIKGIGNTIITATQASTTNFNQYSVNIPIFSICFPAGTPVITDQGSIAIEKINPEINTIRGKKIVAITKTITLEDKIVCIEKDALGTNIPSQKTYISRNHKLLFNKKMVKAKQLIGQVDGVYNKKYNGEILYNVLLETHEKMLVNNLIVETLDPSSVIAQLYNDALSEEEKNQIIVNINECAAEYKKVYGKK